MNLGMGIGFNRTADFSKIFGSLGFWINRVIHSTFIEVNEQGTEAGGATGVEFYRLGSEKIFHL